MRAIALADRMLRDAHHGMTAGERRKQQRLAALVGDQAGRDLVQRLTDEVLRLDEPRRAAQHFSALVAEHGIPASLGLVDRTLLRLGSAAAPLLPGVVMPLVRRRILWESKGLVLPASDPGLARHTARRAREGTSLNLNVLGEAILSDAEASIRLQRVIATLSRPDVGYVSVKISAICAQLDVLAFDHHVDHICDALRRVYRAARDKQPRAFVNLDMEEYADLHLTVAAFTRVLGEPEFHDLEAGIVLQAYLPDSHAELERLGEWAAARVAAGGAPIKVRLVKGANLAMEHVDAEIHGWVQAPYATKAEVDASFKRLLDSCLRPHWAAALRVGVASHNLFEIAWALVLRDELPAEQRGRVEIEMLEGMVPAQARAAQLQAGGLLLYCPVVRTDEIEASLAYLARRFDENTAPQNFLRAMFSMTPDSAEFRDQASWFRNAVADRHTVATTPRRPAEASAPVPGFANQADSDLTSAQVRSVLLGALASPSHHGDFPVLDSIDQIDAVVATAVGSQPSWSHRPAVERSDVLREIARVMQDERADTLALMADEAGKTVREGDPEVSEAIDFARYYSAAALPADATPAGPVVVASPWNFPYAIPAGGVLAALVAGNSVILKPAPEVRRTAWHLAEQCWRAGVPRDVLLYVACPDDEVGRHLVTHDAVGTVVLTGGHATAQMFLGWKPSLRLLAETSGKNAIVVTAAADVDAAIRDIVKSAFGHAGQKCSAASLAIVEAPTYDDPSFLRRLADAVQTLRVGWPTDPATVMGPLIAPPSGPLLRALTTLDAGETWLVQPRQLDESGRLWSPGVKTGVVAHSWFHQTECFGPVLGVMRATSLDHAIELQNGTAFGLTGGIHSLDHREVSRWSAEVQVGNAYVNRHITGAIVQRQPFGGWKRSAVGGGSKAGGPGYVAGFVRPDAHDIDVRAAVQSYRQAWRLHYSVDLDATGLRCERNVLRHHPVDAVLVRVGPDTPAGAAVAALAAAAACGVTAHLSSADHETDAQLAARLPVLSIERLRLLTPASDAVLAACHERDVAVVAVPVVVDGDDELRHWVREQAISETRHRYGRVLP